MAWHLLADFRSINSSAVHFEGYFSEKHTHTHTFSPKIPPSGAGRGVNPCLEKVKKSSDLVGLGFPNPHTFAGLLSSCWTNNSVTIAFIMLERGNGRSSERVMASYGQPHQSVSPSQMMLKLPQTLLNESPHQQKNKVCKRLFKSAILTIYEWISLVLEPPPLPLLF